MRAFPLSIDESVPLERTPRTHILVRAFRYRHCHVVHCTCLRLIDQCPRYLVGVFGRAGEETRRLPSGRERGENESIENAMNGVRDLCISYIVLIFNMPEMFPQPQEAMQRGRLQLLDVLLEAHGSVPPGFLHAIADRCTTDAEIDELMFPTFDALPGLVHGVSLLGNFGGLSVALGGLLRALWGL